MKKIMAGIVITSTLGLLNSFSASAVEFTSPALDFREAYISGSKMFQTRLQISSVINDNIWFSYQNTINHGPHLAEFKSNYSEVETAYTIPVTDKFSVIPDMVFNWGKAGTHIDPILKVSYQLQPDFSVMAGYRYYHNNYKAENIYSVEERNNSHEYDLWFNWQVTKKVFLNYNPVFLQKQNDFRFGNGKKTMWQHTVYANYKYDDRWTPYIDLSDLGRAGNGDKEYRVRIGVKYSL